MRTSIPVYQDEFILGFQSMLDDKWSWGVRGIYRKMHNAIDDMNIGANGFFCGGEPAGVGFVMANPGKPATVFTDTDCDGENDAFVTIDTANAGWPMFGRQLQGYVIDDQRLAEAQAQLQGARVRARPRVGRQVGVECVVHVVVQPRQR